MNGTLNVSFNYVSDILDEIALEGLDGITLEALWMRLAYRPNFCFSIDENSKRFLWNIIVRLKDVRFYEIPEPRLSLKHYNYVQANESIISEIRLELEEAYPYCGVKGVAGVFGSCKHYFRRVDVTIEVLDKTFQEVDFRWGNNLVLVASQSIRSTALMELYSAPNIDFSNYTIVYDILERVGRCRQIGLLTCGEGSLQSVVVDPKTIFHYLKVLISHKLIRKQSLLGSLSSNAHSSIIYLSRFYRESGSDNIPILQMAVEELKSRPPHYMMPCDEFYALFDENKRNRIKRYKKSAVFRKYIRIIPNLPYREIYPDAPQSEWERKSKGKERVVRCFQLVNPNVELTYSGDKDSESDDEKPHSGFLPRGIYFKNIPIVKQAYHHIKNAGSKGMTHDELGHVMGLNKNFIRGLIKRLLTDKLCNFFIDNDGKRRSKRYIVGKHTQTQEAASEIAQILSESVTAAEPKGENEQSNKETEENNEATKVSKLQDENMSYRSLKRIAMIIKTIKANRFRLFHQIKKFVCCEEKKEGLTITVDRVTISNLLKKLEADGLIKTITLTGKDPSDPSIKLFTDPAFDPDEKLKENIYMSEATCRIMPSDSKNPENGIFQLEEEFAEAFMENIKAMKKMLRGIKKTEKKESKNSELTFLHSPKFTRLNILHDFIFHLVYDYTGSVDRSQEALLTELKKSIAIDKDLEKEMPRLYGTQPSTYMFVPPLNNSGKLPGWFLVSDLLTRMPLSLMVKSIRIYDDSPELWHYLNHPIRKNFLVKDLPLSVRDLFFSRKNQISKFYFDLRRLCYIGLVQFGTRFGRELHQSFVYLNRRASLLDTSTGPPAYFQVQPDIKFDVKRYEFRTKVDVKRYWEDMFNICMETNLGEKVYMIGKELLAERELNKESLKKYHEAKTVKQVLEDDDGSLPGDRLGAAGIDSVMYSFLRSNWIGSVHKNSEQTKVKKIIKKPVSKIQRDIRRSQKKTMFETRRLFSTPVSEEVVCVPILKPPKKMKKIKARQIRFKRIRQAFYDETDLEALRAMNTLRVTWSPVEDNLLLVCKVAMMFLCPNSRAFVRIPWVELRRVLQSHIPESRNKTQRAIGRRVIYMMKNPTTVRSVNLCLEALKQMPESKEFDCTDLSERILPSAPNLAELQNKLYAKFRELVAFLKDRFVDNPFATVGNDYDLIPDTLEEFTANYEMEEPAEEDLNIRSIRENVIRATLLSSLCSRSDKTSSAVQLFEIYRQYHENELQNTVQRLNQDKVITVTKRSGGTAFKNGEIIPLNFAPFKLSFAFRHLLNVRYSHSIYPESYSQICKLTEWGEDETEVDLNECNITLFLLAIKNVLRLSPALPEQVIILDKGDLPETTYSKMLKKYCRMLEYSQSKVVCTSGKIIRKPEDTVEIEIGNKRKLPEENDGIDAKRKKSDSSVSGQDFGKSGSSRVILYMMREEAKKVAKHEMGGRLVREFCVVSASKVFVGLKKTDLEEYMKEMEPNVANVIVKNITSRAQFPVNLVDEDSVIANYKGNDVTALKNTLNYIASKGELGATVRDLRKNCAHESLSTFLKILTDENILIKSGINETRYVSQKHSTPWLLSSFKIKRIEREKLKPNDAVAVSLSDEISKKKMKGVVDFKTQDYSPPACSMDMNNKIKVIIRPWIRIDGSLNRKVLDRFLGTVLGFIMAFPGCSLSVVMNKFAPSITPVWTKELVEMLFEIGCLTYTTLLVKKKSSLFCKSHIDIYDKYTGLEDDSCVLIEAKMDALITLGLFIGKKTYTKDFLVD